MEAGQTSAVFNIALELTVCRILSKREEEHRRSGGTGNLLSSMPGCTRVPDMLMIAVVFSSNLGIFVLTV